MDDVIGEQSGQNKDVLAMEMDVVGDEDAIARLVGQVTVTIFYCKDI